MQEKRLGTTLRNLGLALINATLMLCIILALCATFLLRELNEFRDSLALIARDALAPHEQTFERISDRIASIDERLETADGEEIAQIRNEIHGLRQDIPNAQEVAHLTYNLILDKVGEIITNRTAALPSK